MKGKGCRLVKIPEMEIDSDSDVAAARYAIIMQF
jgi:hypothetical protein